MSSRMPTIPYFEGFDSLEGQRLFHVDIQEHNVTSSPIVDAIIFSRHFVPFYYLFLLLLLAGIALYGRAEQYTRCRRLQVYKAPCSTTSASPRGSPTPKPEHTPSGRITEETALLSTHKELAAGERTHFRLLSRLRACLLFQPRSLPALTSARNQLPSNGTSLIIVAVLLINVFLLFHKNAPSPRWAQPFADRAGLCFTANLPVLYLLGAKNNPLKWVSGWSYEVLNIVHRRIGEWMVLLACIHAAGMFTLWYRIFRPLGYTLGRFLSLKIIVLGFAAFIAILLIYVTSTGRFRQKCYEVFLMVHIFLQMAVLGLLYFHHRNARPYCIAAGVIWILDRMVARFLVSRKRFVATLEIAPDRDTVLLFCDVNLSSSKYKGIRSGWQAGQHVFVTIPSIGWNHGFQAHPFTIASPAPCLASGVTSWPLQLIIRGHGGFSADLLEYAKWHQHTEIFLDGPYGGTEVLEALKSSDRSCLIAGGSGISVTYPLAWAVHDVYESDRIVTNRTTYQRGIKRTPKLDIMDSHFDSRQHCQFWIRQSHEQGKWITMFPRHKDRTMGSLFVDANTADTQAINLITKSFVTKGGSGERPDVETELRNWLDSLPPVVAGRRQRICVVVSGPDELARLVRNCVARLVKEGNDIQIFVEKFGW